MEETIVALATASGSGAISIIRLSGKNSFEIAEKIFIPHSKKRLSELPSHTIHLGYVHQQEMIIDECLAMLFQGNRSYTGEPVVEFSCHGSPYIQQKIIQLCIENGARVARAGEFTLRAFINGKMDLSQAEAVADLIASDNEAAHQIAMQQVRGGFTNEIQLLREQLLNFASLIELELDFSEEDVEFANRSELKNFIVKIQKILARLIDSFAMGNVIKNGIPVAIVGEPNVGKSTLLNALLNEERAIVSNIAGTTRDTIEDEIAIGGVPFRFIDTAGIRQTDDTIEKLGIERSFQKMGKAQIVLYLIDCQRIENENILNSTIEHLNELKTTFTGQKFVAIANKSDLLSKENKTKITHKIPDIILISAKNKEGISDLQELLLSFVNRGLLRSGQTIVTNTRHYEALLNAQNEIQKVQEGLLKNISSDLLAIDIRGALYHFGEITGEITTDNLLENIFSKFCIGK